MNETANKPPANKRDLESVKPYVLAVCRQYLSGIWKAIELDDFQIEKLPSLSNYIFKCVINTDIVLNSSDNDNENAPTQIVFRLYGEATNKKAVLTGLIVSTMISRNKMGPKLYGIFETGRIEEYFPVKTIVYNDYFNSEINAAAGAVLAQFHTQKMPVNKETQLYATLEEFARQLPDLKFSHPSDTAKLKQLLSFNLPLEFAALKVVLDELNSPVVFCHNDMWAPNLLKLSDKKLMLIDYEYSSYSYRGFDFGVYFQCWLIDTSYTEYPFFKYNFENYPSAEQQSQFARSYIESYSQYNQERIARNPEKILKFEEDFSYLNVNEPQLLKEINYYTLMSLIYYSLWAMCQAQGRDLQTQFDYLGYALVKCDAYFQLKSKLFPDGYYKVQ